MQQVRNLLECDVIKDDWKRRGTNGVVIHGWVYQLEDVGGTLHRGATQLTDRAQSEI